MNVNHFDDDNHRSHDDVVHHRDDNDGIMINEFNLII